MNNGHPNQGLRCICSIVERYAMEIDYKVYDVRVENEVPDLSYDMYISSGGPGNPLVGNGVWEVKFTDLIDRLWEHNKRADEADKKYAFFICHSFQLVCNHFQLGEITKRHATSFGVLPVHKTKAGKIDRALNKLKDKFYAIDSRDWQLIQPNLRVFKKWGAQILALEKIRDHVAYERAIMAVRFSEEFVGTQFHPEADAEGMIAHLEVPENQQKIITTFGQRKYNQMMKLLPKPETIAATQAAILPNFIEHAIRNLQPTMVP